MARLLPKFVLEAELAALIRDDQKLQKELSDVRKLISLYQKSIEKLEEEEQ
jgi:hypothetical protein